MDLPQDHIKAIDQLRTRLSQLSTSLNLLLHHLESQRAPPAWPSLQADATSVGVNLAELADVLNSQRQLFSALHAHPMPNYPGLTEELRLQGMLRKKLDPRAEAWIDEALKSKKAMSEDEVVNLLSADEMEKIWESAKPVSREIMAPMLEEEVFDDDYTIEERVKGVENIVTGVKRIDEGEDDDEDKMDEDQPLKTTIVPGADPTKAPEPLENLLRFTATGELNAPGLNR